MKKKIILEIIYVSFLILWAYAAFSKLFAFDIFSTQLGKSPLLRSVAPVAAIGVPVIELVLAAMLIMERTKKIGLIGSLVLMVIFTVYLIGILAFSTDIPCSCGGLLQDLTWKQHVFFNLGVIVLATIGVFLQGGRFSNWKSDKMNKSLVRQSL
ncbi:MauE/DoxX family redox-associated membrane protein [Chitinophaga cymbidii]|uniref:MauE/DoxX family redox-associated membrane protein n=1 Tax=Chitinophaga cymbidii TaxID=1096750 RepID=UPI00164ADAA8|nr:MauE/DoxX family redox-associated membrane protein [Chitinophaga cymbidii]